MKYKAAMFDLDGTLLDTLDDLGDSCNHVIEAAGYPTHPVEAYKYFVGEGIEMLVTRALPEDQRSAENAAATVDKLKAHYAGNWANKTRPYDGIVELLASLTALGLALTVLSNKPDEATKQVIGHFFPDTKFKIVRGARHDLPKKPDPSGALNIAGKLGITPAEFIYIGDTATDMKTAVSAGMYPVGVSWGFRAVEELRNNGAKLLIDEPSELLTLLK